MTKSMSDDYSRQKLQEAIENRRRSIADLEYQRTIYGDRPEILRQLEKEQKELTNLQERLIVLSGSVADEPRRGPLSVSMSFPPPSQAAIVFALLLFIAGTLAALAIVAYFLENPFTILAVFLVFLITLAVILPYIGLQTQTLKDHTFFQAYLAALEKIPGLDILIKAWLAGATSKDKDDG